MTVHLSHFVGSPPDDQVIQESPPSSPKKVSHSKLYSELNLEHGKGIEDVKNAYRKLSKEYHPDLCAQKFSGDESSEVIRDYYTERFSRVNESYSILSDKKMKAKYDLYGEKGRSLVLRDENKFSNDLSDIGEEDRYKNSIREAYLRQKRKTFDEETRVQVTHELSLDVSKYTRLQKLTFLRPHAMVNTTKFQVPVNEKNLLIMSSSHVDRGMMNQKHSTAFTWRHVFSEEALTDIIFTWHNQIAITTIAMYHKFFSAQNRDSQAFLRWHLLSYPMINIAGFDFGFERALSDERKIYLQTDLGMFSQMITAGIASDVTDISLKVSKIENGSENTISFVYSQPLDEEIQSSKLEDELQEHLGAELNHELSITQGTPIDDGPSFDITTTYMQSISESTNIGIGVGSGSEGVHIDLVLSRGRNKLSIPCFINFEFHWKTFLLSSVLPAVCFNTVKRFIYGPYKRRKEINKQREKREEIFRETTAQRQKVQQELNNLMVEILSKKEEEMNVNGVVIMNARYGNLSEEANSFEMKYPPWIDVTDSLQYYVKDHRIDIIERPFYTLKGFYDPCPGEKKHLHVVYKFQNKLHEFQVADGRSFSLPLSEHFVKELNDDDNESISSDDSD